MKKQFFFLVGGLLVLPLLLLLVQSEAGYYRQLIGPEGRISLSQYAAAKKLEAQTGGAKILWDDTTLAAPFMIGGDLQQTVPIDDEAVRLSSLTAATLDFFEKNKALYGLKNPAQELRMVKDQTDEAATYLTFQQHYQGIPVYGGEIIARVRPDGTLDNLAGHYFPVSFLSINPAINSEKALEIVAQSLGLTSAKESLVELMIVNLNVFENQAQSQTDEFRLAWRVELGNWVYFIDAQTGEIIDKYSLVTEARNRETYLAKQDGPVNTPEDLKKTLWANESGRVSEIDNLNAEDAHKNAIKVYDFFKNRFNWDSYDGEGSKMITSVDGVGPRFPACNAAWVGGQGWNLVFFGKSGETLGFNLCPYKHFSLAVDAVGHEWTHGVVFSRTTLQYLGQSGGIHETLADFYGEMIEGRMTWKIGEDLSTQNPPKPLRNMADPRQSESPQPDHVDQINSEEVHYLCGVTNKASYLLAAGGSHRGITVQGIGEEKVSQLYWRVIFHHLTTVCNFSCFREKVLLACGELPQICGQAEKNAIKNAFAAVGVGQPAPTTSGTPSPSTTPRPTATAGPSPTPGGPTNTPQPSATSGPSPTGGPLPTATPTPEGNFLFLKARFESSSSVNQLPFLFTLSVPGTNFSQKIVIAQSGEVESISLEGLETGKTYDFILSSYGYLAAKRSLTIAEGRNPPVGYLDFGYLGIGDLNQDNQINALDWSWMKLNYGASGE